MKYVVIRCGSVELAFLFPSVLNHIDVANGLMRPIDSLVIRSMR